MNKIEIFNSQFRPILQEAKAMRATIKESSKIPEHPLETGAIINDHKIINPVEVEVVFFIGNGQTASVYQVIQQLFKSNELLTVQTKTSSYSNMTIADLPHEETPDVSDGVFVTVKFRAANLTTAQFGVLPSSSVSNKSQASTTDRGEQQPRPASAGFELFFGK